MARRSGLDQRFAEFCRTGDPAALGAVFDGTARELLHVATWLMRHRADAEDLLQRTFLAAIETRARFAPGQPVVPWLMGLLANEARHLRRERERRLAAAPPPARDPEAEAAALELDAAVRAAGDELGEPYRDVLRLHLEAGLNAREIAARLRRPAGTVRTQLVRGLEQLRRRLPGGFVAGIAVVVAVDDTAVAAVRQVVMAAAKQAMPVAVAGAAGTAAAAFGGVLMAKKLVFALVSIVLLGCLFVWITRPTTAARPGNEATAAQAATVDGDRDTSMAAVPTGAQLQREAAPAPTDADPGFASLRIVVHWQKDARPAAGVGVRAANRANSDLLNRSAVTGDDGAALLPHLLPGSYYIQGSWLADDEQVTEVMVAAGEQKTISLVAAPTSTVSGKVVDAEGYPMAGAAIWQSVGSSWSIEWPVGRSAADGTFEVPMRGLQYLGARLAGHLPSFAKRLLANEGPHRDVVLTLRGRAASLRGTVRDARGAPVPWALVRVGPPGGGGVSDASGFALSIRPNPESLSTDARGQFLAQEVPPGSGMLWVWAHGFAPLQASYAAAPGGTGELELTLADAAVVHGVVHDAQGEPVAGAGIRFGDEYHSFPCVYATSDPLGRFELADLPSTPGGVLLVAGKDEVGARATLDLHPGARTEWNPVLDGGRTICGKVLLPDGAAAPGLQVGAVHPGYQRVSHWSTTDAEGRFRLLNVGDQPRALHVARDRVVLQAVADVAPDREDVVIRLEARDLGAASVRGRVLMANGEPAVGSIVLQRDGPFLLEQQQLDANGSFAFTGLPAVRYTEVPRELRGRLCGKALPARRLHPKQPRIVLQNVVTK